MLILPDYDKMLDSIYPTKVELVGYCPTKIDYDKMQDNIQQKLILSDIVRQKLILPDYDKLPDILSMILPDYG